ncbi:MAG: transposase [Lysobacterales bacterium]
METEDAAVAFNSGTGRRRRTFTPAFKAEAIECCLQLGVSIAAVARAYDLHPNLLRRWVITHREAQKPSDDVVNILQEESPLPLERLAPAEQCTKFVPVRRLNNVPAPIPPVSAQAPGAQGAVVRIELRSAARDITLHWPAAEHHALSQLLREVLA